jgi:hypothetical protein
MAEEAFKNTIRRKKPTEIVPCYLLPISAREKLPAPPSKTRNG